MPRTINISASGNQALFSLLSTQYGGNEQFLQLLDLREAEF